VGAAGGEGREEVVEAVAVGFDPELAGLDVPQPGRVPDAASGMHLVVDQMAGEHDLTSYQLIY